MENPIKDQTLKDIKAGKYRHCYLVYIRKSTDEPDNQKNSITYQKAEGAKFATREKLPIATLSLAGFCVDGVISERHSGFKEDGDLTFSKDGLVQYHVDRPKFLMLAQFLSLGLFKGVISLCWDRLSRNKGDNTIISKLMRNGLDFRLVYANYDNTSSGALHMDIDGMFAEHHSRVTSEKVRLTQWNLRERGVVAYKAPIGYLNQGSMEHKPFDPERAPLIKKLFEHYATGQWTLADLVRFASNQGLNTVPARRRRTPEEMLGEEDDDTEIEKVSRPLTVTNIQKILTNPFYTGRTFGNENSYIRSVSHDALISDELFNQVQVLLKKKRVSLHYSQKLELPFRGLIRCGDCRRIYTPYLQKGIQYFGARCATECSNMKKSFNISFVEKGVGGLIDSLIFTEDELAGLEATAAIGISAFEEKRLKELAGNDQRKKKIREDLAYLRMNKLSLLKSGVYTAEALMAEENGLNAELVTLQDRETISDRSMHAVIADLFKLSELLKIGSALYVMAKPPEKEAWIKLIFSELSISENTLQFKCKNGFQPLEHRIIIDSDPTGWLSEAWSYNNLVNDSIADLQELLEGNPSQAP